MSFIRKKKPLHLDGLFDEPIGPIRLKRRLYENQFIRCYLPPVILAEEIPRSDSLVFKPKEKGGSKWKCKVVKTNVVRTKVAKPKREHKSRPVCDPALQVKTKETKSRPEKTPKLKKPGLEFSVYQPSPEEIAVATNIMKDLNRSRVGAILDTRDEE